MPPDSSIHRMQSWHKRASMASSGGEQSGVLDAVTLFVSDYAQVCVYEQDFSTGTYLRLNEGAQAVCRTTVWASLIAADGKLKNLKEAVGDDELALAQPRPHKIAKWFSKRCMISYGQRFPSRSGGV